jgi:hypothetical protein
MVCQIFHGQRLGDLFFTRFSRDAPEVVIFRSANRCADCLPVSRRSVEDSLDWQMC